MESSGSPIILGEAQAQVPQWWEKLSLSKVSVSFAVYCWVALEVLYGYLSEGLSSGLDCLFISKIKKNYFLLTFSLHPFFENFPLIYDSSFTLEKMCPSTFPISDVIFSGHAPGNLTF